MMLCSRCHKRPAVVFISPTDGSGDPQGLCLTCAKELGIKPVNDILEKMGMNEEQLASMETELGNFNPYGKSWMSDGVKSWEHFGPVSRQLRICRFSISNGKRVRRE